MALSDYDRRLLDRCLARDARAWEEFVDRFAGLFSQIVDHAARTRGVDLDSAAREDLMAEILLVLVRDNMAVLRRFQRRASLATYLTVVGRRVALRQLLRGLKQPRTNAELEPHLEELLQPEFENSEQVTYLLSRLGEAEARLVRGYYLQGLSYRELSTELQVPENSIGPTLQRARQKMLTLLEQASSKPPVPHLSMRSAAPHGSESIES
ncbi:MAG: sigma-70 family RNA polymerase sigma factor [Pirellulaceae bacterium]|nr:sigma-70 family RNA polymerase sigma factor [Planctomycetales bacterium]